MRWGLSALASGKIIVAKPANLGIRARPPPTDICKAWSGWINLPAAEGFTGGPQANDRELISHSPHPFKGNENKVQDRQRGRNHPPWGRVVLPSLPLGWT